MKSGDFPPQRCGAACGADLIRQKLRGANTHRNTHVYMLHKHIYRCTLSLHQTHNSLFYTNAMRGIVFHFTECLTLFALFSHFVTQCSVSA